MASHIFQQLTDMALHLDQLDTPAADSSSQAEPVVAFKDDEAEDAEVNARLLEHAVTCEAHPHRALHQELVVWFTRMNEAFFEPRLPTAAIALERTRPSALGTYQPWRDGLALRYRITIGTNHLDRPKGEVLRTLLHEMVHQWEEVECGRQKGGNYHTASFSRRAKELGIPVQPRTGQSLGIAPDGPFATLLAQFGISLDEASLERTCDEAPSSARVSLKPWACGCTRIWAAAKTEVSASCAACGARFERAAARTTSAGGKSRA